MYFPDMCEKCDRTTQRKYSRIFNIHPMISFDLFKLIQVR